MVLKSEIEYEKKLKYEAITKVEKIETNINMINVENIKTETLFIDDDFLFNKIKKR